MQIFRVRTALSVLFVILLISAMLPVSAKATDGTIYINDETEPITEPLDSLYAVGGDENTSALNADTVYAMTANGLQLVEGSKGSAAPVPTSTPAPESDYDEETPAYTTVKVGLYYGSSALTEARLENAVGSGYLFGYYDDLRQFHEVGSTDVTTLTMVTDLNVTKETDISLGCFHILLPSSYATFAEAKAKADEVGGFPAYYNGVYFALYGHYQTTTETQAAINELGIQGTVYSASNKCVVVTQTGTDKILFEFDCGSAYSLAIRPVCESEKAVTWFKQLKYYGDFQYARLSGDEYLTVVNYVDIEDYTKGVVPYEMSASWHIEALKAQALCARNYAVTNFNRYRAQGFDVTADTYSQVYKGVSDYESINQAVDATAGQYIRYEGSICQTYFFSSDGGATESSENVWGNAVAYLVGVEDPYEADVETGMKNWSYSMTGDQVAVMLNERLGSSMDTIESISCEYTDMGNIKSLAFVDTGGKVFTVSNNRCVYAVNANSPRFSVIKNDEGNFVITGSGWGHNCGMSQYGAYAMAKHYGKTAEEIIKFYFTGVYIR